MKNYKNILSLDPSGSFHEGKGTTGWCILDAEQNKVIHTGFISARDYQTKEGYWEAHIQLILSTAKKYKTPIMVVIEDYILYASTAEAQINSRFETTKLIGILQYIMHKHNINYRMQRAVDVKNRWTNEILVYKNIIKQIGVNKYEANGEKINRHVLDSIRHVTHFNTFYNEKE